MLVPLSVIIRKRFSAADTVRTRSNAMSVKTTAWVVYHSEWLIAIPSYAFLLIIRRFSVTAGYCVSEKLRLIKIRWVRSWSDVNCSWLYSSKYASRGEKTLRFILTERTFEKWTEFWPTDNQSISPAGPVPALYASVYWDLLPLCWSV